MSMFVYIYGVEVYNRAEFLHVFFFVRNWMLMLMERLNGWCSGKPTITRYCRTCMYIDTSSLIFSFIFIQRLIITIAMPAITWLSVPLVQRFEWYISLYTQRCGTNSCIRKYSTIYIMKSSMYPVAEMLHFSCHSNRCLRPSHSEPFSPDVSSRICTADQYRRHQA